MEQEAGWPARSEAKKALCKDGEEGTCSRDTEWGEATGDQMTEYVMVRGREESLLRCWVKVEPVTETQGI